MFDRKKYKEIAKKQLKGRWKTPVLATLVFMLVFGAVEAPEVIDSLSHSQAVVNAAQGVSVHISEESTVSPWVSLGAILLEGVCLIAYTYLFLVLSHTREPQPFSVFIRGFTLWLRGILGFLWMLLWVVLWMLLFFIPGLVKAYAYSQMFFILAECPDVGVMKALRMSKAMTKGYKWDLFVLDLSFLGWALLGACTCGILYLWLLPYINMTQTNAYHALKAQAIRSGVLTAADFGRVQPALEDSTAESADAAAAAAPAADAGAYDASAGSTEFTDTPPALDDGSTPGGSF